MIGVSNDGMHDFGYPCSMPRDVTIDGLVVEDSNVPDDYDGLYLFTDPDAGAPGVEPVELGDERPFAYARCQEVRIRDLTMVSGKRWRVSPNAELEGSIVVIEEAY